MSQKHKRVLRSILEGPVSGNIHWREVESLLREEFAAVSSIADPREP